MKKRSECSCPCHKDDLIMHSFPCCEPNEVRFQPGENDIHPSSESLKKWNEALKLGANGWYKISIIRENGTVTTRFCKSGGVMADKMIELEAKYKQEIAEAVIMLKKVDERECGIKAWDIVCNVIDVLDEGEGE